MVLIGCIVFRKVILKTEFVLLLFACGFFVLSLCFDALHLPHGSVGKYLEDATKFAGIVSWFLYFTRTCFKEMFSCVKASLV